jgi:hypothetical protein
MDPGIRPLLSRETSRKVLETECLAMNLLLTIGKGLNIGATQHLALRHTDAGRYPSTIRKQQRGDENAFSRRLNFPRTVMGLRRDDECYCESSTTQDATLLTCVTPALRQTQDKLGRGPSGRQRNNSIDTDRSLS